MSSEFNNFGSELLDNPVFLSAIFSLLITQFIKSMISVIRSKSRSVKDMLTTFFWKTGGMPSSHSAIAVAISTSIAFRNGVKSNIFVLSIFFTLVIIRDALGVRRAAGQQARAINNISKELNQKFSLPLHHVKEVNGHSFSEVLIGSLLGFTIALAFCTL